MRWFRHHQQESVAAEALTGSLLKLTLNAVKDASQALREDPDSRHLSKPEVEEELLFFLVFALDYYWTTQPSRTRHEQRIFREAFLVHFGNMGRRYAFEERMTAYGIIAGEKKNINDMLWGLALKLCRFCGVPADLHLMTVVPNLFAKAFDAAAVLEPVPLVNR